MFSQRVVVRIVAKVLCYGRLMTWFFSLFSLDISPLERDRCNRCDGTCCVFVPSGRFQQRIKVISGDMAFVDQILSFLFYFRR
jgi:hypothetical protein